MDLQQLIVTVVAALAALYAGRAMWRQFGQPDDEPRGCAACPAKELGQTGDKRQPQRGRADSPALYPNIQP
jgi:hypothetical protein